MAALQLWLQWVRPCLPLPSCGSAAPRPTLLPPWPRGHSSPFPHEAVAGPQGWAPFSPVPWPWVTLGCVLACALLPPSPGGLSSCSTVCSHPVSPKGSENTCAHGTHTCTQTVTCMFTRACTTCVHVMHKHVHIHTYPLFVHLSHTCPHAHTHPAHQGLPLPSHLVVLPWPPGPRPQEVVAPPFLLPSRPSPRPVPFSFRVHPDSASHPDCSLSTQLPE